MAAICFRWDHKSKQSRPFFMRNVGFSHHFSFFFFLSAQIKYILELFLSFISTPDDATTSSLSRSIMSDNSLTPTSRCFSSQPPNALTHLETAQMYHTSPARAFISLRFEGETEQPLILKVPKCNAQLCFKRHKNQPGSDS